MCIRSSNEEQQVLPCMHRPCTTAMSTTLASCAYQAVVSVQQDDVEGHCPAGSRQSHGVVLPKIQRKDSFAEARPALEQEPSGGIGAEDRRS